MSGEILSDGVNEMGAEAATAGPPPHENIDDVKARVGDDAALASRVLDAERSGENRSTLVSWLEGVVRAAEEREAKEREEAEAAEREDGAADDDDDDVNPAS
jgi:septal ring factor EnvC (AmiA/AmiB activator)